MHKEKHLIWPVRSLMWIYDSKAISSIYINSDMKGTYNQEWFQNSKAYLGSLHDTHTRLRFTLSSHQMIIYITNGDFIICQLAGKSSILCMFQVESSHYAIWRLPSFDDNSSNINSKLEMPFKSSSLVICNTWFFLYFIFYIVSHEVCIYR